MTSGVRANRDEPGMGSDRLVRAHGRSDVGSRRAAEARRSIRRPAPGAPYRWPRATPSSRSTRSSFASGIAAATASRKAQQLTFATNWFLNNYVKIYATYERFSVLGRARANENLILFRTQLAF